MGCDKDCDQGRPCDCWEDGSDDFDAARGIVFTVMLTALAAVIGIALAEVLW